ncbi:MAG: lysylphosphatidylglycerol synthase transmembrane domain-containing protein, partial [Clostridiales bacterium]
MNSIAENKKQQLVSLVVIVGVLALTYVFLVKNQELPKMADLFHQIHVEYLLVGTGVMLLFFGLEAVSLRILLGVFRYQPGFWRCYSYSLINFYFSAITPGCCGGQPSQLYYMKRDGIELGSSSLTVLLFNVSYHISAMMIVISALLWGGKLLLADLGVLKYLLLCGIIAQAVCITAYGLAVFSPRLAPIIAEKVVKLLAKLHIVKNKQAILEKAAYQVGEYQRGAVYVKSHPAILGKVLVLTTLHLLALYSIPFWIYKAFGLSGQSFAMIVAIQTTMTLSLESLPIPGGVGIAEGSFLLIYSSIFGPA